jgi:hypothetical protein
MATATCSHLLNYVLTEMPAFDDSGFNPIFLAYIQASDSRLSPACLRNTRGFTNRVAVVQAPLLASL